MECCLVQWSGTNQSSPSASLKPASIEKICIMKGKTCKKSNMLMITNDLLRQPLVTADKGRLNGSLV